MKIKTMFVLGVVLVGGAALAVNYGENLRGMIAGGSEMADGPEAAMTATEAANALTGLWQSKEDATFRREFMADGTLVDTYGAGNATVTMGTWIVFTADMPLPDGATFQLNMKDAYVGITTGTVPDYYRIASATAADLELVHMTTAGTLSFTRVR